MRWVKNFEFPQYKFLAIVLFLKKYNSNKKYSNSYQLIKIDVNNAFRIFCLNLLLKSLLKSISFIVSNF